MFLFTYFWAAVSVVDDFTLNLQECVEFPHILKEMPRPHHGSTKDLRVNIKPRKVVFQQA